MACLTTWCLIPRQGVLIVWVWNLSLICWALYQFTRTLFQSKARQHKIYIKKNQRNANTQILIYTDDLILVLAGLGVHIILVRFLDHVRHALNELQLKLLLRSQLDCLFILHAVRT